ncbi:MAG: branched-chain-amino-acid transaminase [Spirochaetia bacterium]
MAQGFTLSVYPWTYLGKYTGSIAPGEIPAEDTGNGNPDNWKGKYLEGDHRSPSEEQEMSADEQGILLRKRNHIKELPLVNYTTQYGLGCFEGLKAFPQPDGKLKLFRPDENGRRMAGSMEGLMMPVFPPDLFVKAVKEVVKRNYEMGFYPGYDKSWEKDDFTSGHSVYIRPFSYSEGAIGLGLSAQPWVVIVTTPVGSYFKPGTPSAVTTDRIRAVKRGTGWIKCNANYVIPIMAKKEAEKAGYMEAIFLDAAHRKYVEEGSSCNIFFYLKSGTLVTPSLEDTILPGINRKSIITLAREKGITVAERRISIEEAVEESREVFVTGTAAGVAYIESITHNGKKQQFSGGQIGELTRELRNTLKGIQYGSIEDKYGWMTGI